MWGLPATRNGRGSQQEQGHALTVWEGNEHEAGTAVQKGLGTGSLPGGLWGL